MPTDERTVTLPETALLHLIRAVDYLLDNNTCDDPHMRLKQWTTALFDAKAALGWKGYQKDATDADR
jgi:hypothetical protein